MADLPPIPDEAWNAACLAAAPYCENLTAASYAVRETWPHLYAAALRHAAADVLQDDDACSDLLRAAAFAAVDPGEPATPKPGSKGRIGWSGPT